MVSETRKRFPEPRVMRWFDEVDDADLFISVLTIGELTKGIAKRRRSDPQAADSLAHWLHGIELLFADRVLPIDVRVATVWGKLSARQTLPVIDTLLAATAEVHGLTVVSRNVRDIERTGGRAMKPWQIE